MTSHAHVVITSHLTPVHTSIAALPQAPPTYLAVIVSVARWSVRIPRAEIMHVGFRH
jgi:hypothetical protein